MKFIAFASRNWPKWIATLAIWCVLVAVHDLLLRYWHTGRPVIGVVDLVTFVIACKVGNYLIPGMWTMRISTIAFIFAFFVAPSLLLYLHVGRLTTVIVQLVTLVIAFQVDDYTGRAPSVLGVSGIGLFAGGLCGYAIFGAGRFGSSAAEACIFGGAIVGLIVCLAIYAATDFMTADRRHPGRYSKRMILSERPPIVDRSPATSCPIDER